MFCEKCGTKLQDNEQFCPNCGTPRSVAQQSNNLKTSKEKKYKPKKQKTAMPAKTKKTIIALTSVIIALVVAIGVLLPVLNAIKHAKDTNVIFYVDNGELYSAKTNNEGSVRLSKKLLLAQDYSDSAYYLRDVCVNGTHYLRDSNTVIFPDRLDTDGGATFSLYSLKLDKKANETDPTKIDGDIRYGYKLTSDGQRLYYTKTDKSFYCNDFNERKKIADNVSNYYVNDTGSVIIFTTYVDEKTGLYVVNADTLEIIKIADDADLNYCSDDYSAFSYTAGNAIYLLLNGAQAVKIADFDSENSYANIEYANSKGQAVYSISERDSGSIPLASFIEDDLLQSDAKITEPDKNDKRYWEEWTEGWYTRVTKYTDEYNRLYEQYTEKRDRDYLRNNIKDATVYASDRALYYYDGTNTQQLTAHENYTPYQLDDLVVFSAYNLDTVGTVKISELYASNSDLTVSDVRDAISEKIQKSIKFYIAKSGTVSEIAADTTLNSFAENKDKTSLFYLSYSDDNEGSDLYKLDLNGGQVGQPKLIYTNVSGFFFNDDGAMVNFRDPIVLKDSYYTTCDLYVNETKIDTGVYLMYELPESSVNYSNDGTLFYQTDVSTSGTYSFTVKQYDGKETKVLATDVSQYFPIAQNNIFFIDNYSDSSYEGDLKHFDGKETLKVAGSALVVFSPDDK